MEAPIGLADLSASISERRGVSLISELLAQKLSGGVSVVDLGAADVYFIQPEMPWLDRCLSRQFAASQNVRYFVDDLTEEVVARLQANGSLLVIDLSTEGSTWEVETVRELEGELAARGIPLSQVVLVTANYALCRKLSAVSPGQPKPVDIRVMHHNVYLSKAARLLGLMHEAEAEHLSRIAPITRPFSGYPAQDYICTNLAPRPHRIMLAASLIKAEIFSHGFVSFSDLKSPPPAKNMNTSAAHLAQVLGALFSADEEDLQAVERLREMGRLVIDNESVNPVDLEFKVPLGLVADSWFSLITESTMIGPSSTFVTEKSLKPIHCLQPFIMFGSAFSLGYLRDLGFKTFAPMIDETYDTIGDPKPRFWAAFEEVKRLVRMAPEQKRELWQTLREVVEHNGNHLCSGALATIKRDFSWPLLLAGRPMR